MVIITKHLIILYLFLTTLLLFGCSIISMLQENSIPRRYYFTGDIPQKSYAELRKSFNERYALVQSELRKLEQLSKSKGEDKYVEQIREHRDYLETMDEYLFLCPEHSNVGKGNSKRCRYCGKLYRGSILGKLLK